MDQLRQVTDLRPALEPRVRTTLDDYRIGQYGVCSAKRGCGKFRGAATGELSVAERGLAWEMAGDQAPLSQADSARFSAQLMAVQERERKRIAADLHDGIGQSLSLIKMSMETAMQLMQAGQNERAIESMQRMVHRVKDTIAELRRTTVDLHPPMLDDLGIIPTITWFLREFEATCPGKKIERQIDIAESDVPVALKATIFRILQEAMNNIAKHANADRIRVHLNKPGSVIQFGIEDNGQGFDPDRLAASRCRSMGFGLVTMKERAISSQGAFSIETRLGYGTRILVTWNEPDGTAAACAADNCEADNDATRER